MRWKEILIGALVALFVTVVAGIIIYYTTKEASPPRPSEKLVYLAEKPNCFKTEQTKLALQTVRAANLGDKEARDVRLAIKFDEGVSVLDKKVLVSSGPAASFKDNTKFKNLVDLSFPTLLANETITVSMMLNVSINSPPEIGFRSSSSIGTLGPLVHEVVSQDKKRSVAKGILPFLIPFAAILQLPFVLLLSRRFRSRLRHFIPTLRSVNDTAFLYIHQGLVKEARDLLRNEINNRGADAITLANYGLALGLDGDVDAAEKRLTAAGWWAQLRHEKAVVAFNWAILKLSTGGAVDKAKEYLEQALSLSGSEIRRYCKFSQLMVHIKDQYPELAELLTEGS